MTRKEKRNNMVENNAIRTVKEEERRQSRRRKFRELKLGSLLAILLVVCFVLLPIYIMLITSLTSSVESNNAAFSWWPKLGLTLKSYITAFTRKTAGNNLLVSLWNTLKIYIPSCIVGVYVSAMAAFAYAKTEFVLKKPMFSILMFSLTLPNTVGVIASFLLFDKLGWINTVLPLMVPRMMGSIGIIFFLRQFYTGIPDDLMSAARMDGLGNFGIFVKIMLPVSKPALIAQLVLDFIGGYNQYLEPLLYLQDASQYTLQISLAFFAEAYVQDWPLRMAGCVIAMTPLLLLYLFAQKHLLSSMAVTSGLKG